MLLATKPKSPNSFDPLFQNANLVHSFVDITHCGTPISTNYTVHYTYEGERECVCVTVSLLIPHTQCSYSID